MNNSPQERPENDWSEVERVIDRWGQRLQEIEAERKAAEPAPLLRLQSLDQPQDVQSAEDLFWQLPE